MCTIEDTSMSLFCSEFICPQNTLLYIPGRLKECKKTVEDYFIRGKIMKPLNILESMQFTVIADKRFYDYDVLLFSIINCK